MSSTRWKISPLNSIGGKGVLNTEKTKKRTYTRRKRDDSNYNGLRDVLQCKSKTIKKQRCKNRTSKTKKCWIHLGKENNLRIKKSTIPGAGEGLFSYKKPIKKNKKIDAYIGQEVTRKSMDTKYGKNKTAPYALCNTQNLTPKTRCVDAFKTTDCAARYSNDCKRSKLPCNAFFSNRFNLKSQRKIKPNTEIFVDELAKTLEVLRFLWRI